MGILTRILIRNANSWENRESLSALARFAISQGCALWRPIAGAACGAEWHRSLLRGGAQTTGRHYFVVRALCCLKTATNDRSAGSLDTDMLCEPEFFDSPSLFLKTRGESGTGTVGQSAVRRAPGLRLLPPDHSATAYSQARPMGDGQRRALECPASRRAAECQRTDVGYTPRRSIVKATSLPSSTDGDDSSTQNVTCPIVRIV